MRKKILIAGAGIGGLTTSIALAQRGFQVEVFEQAPQLTEVGAGIQLSPNAMQVMTALGVAEQLETRAFEPEAVWVRHYQTANTFFTTPFRSMCRTRYGAPYLHVHRADLLTVLQKAAEKSGVHLHLDAKVKSFVQNGDSVSLELQNNDTHHGDVLIGADGMRSMIREQMLGKQDLNFTGQVAWRGIVSAEKIPSGLIAPGVTVWVGHGRHIVIYYLRGGSLINFVAVEERDDWNKESWSEPGDVTELRKAFSGWRPEVTKVLSMAEETFLWALYDRKPFEKWSEGHTVLLGDACHPMLPFMAQGAAMAIEDSFVLAKYLAQHDLSTNEALQAFEAKRKPRTSQIQQASRNNADVYHMKGGVFGSLRLGALKALTYLAPQLSVSKLDEIYAYDVTRNT